jgi:choline dehydrogenase-like flavoprotein
VLIDLHRSRLPVNLAADVLVVGAGAVGLSLAVDLVRYGAEVIVVEAGPAGVEKQSQEFFEAASWHGYPLEGLHVGRFRALGGTTNVWPGQLVPFDPIVFENRPWVSDHHWPIDHATLGPYYEKAFDILGLQRRKPDDEVWRLLSAPLPDMGEDLDLFLTRWTPEPNFSVLFQKEIAQHPKLHVIVNATVTSLSLTDDRQNVRQVKIHSSNGTTHCLSARDVVLANGTIEIARLLSLPLSNGTRPPWADNSWLGRGFTDHVDAYAGSVEPIDEARFHALFDNIMLKGLKYCPRIKLSQTAQRRERLLGIAASFLFNSKYKEDLDRLKVLVKSLLRGKIDSGVLAIPGRTVPLARIALPMALRYLFYRRTYNHADRGIQLRLSSEQVPMKTSRLHLRPDRDSLGMPQVDLEWLIDGAELETMAQFCEKISALFRRENLAHIDLSPLLVARDRAFLTGIDDGNHQMGMARMSSTAGEGVVDADLRVHGSDNLYVAGAATFPTTGFANPTLTAIALGLRLSDHLMAEQRGSSWHISPDACDRQLRWA